MEAWALQGSKTPLLDKGRSPEDLRALPEADLLRLAGELRQETVDAVSITGGRLGAGLGVIEPTVALHYSFDTFRDRNESGYKWLHRNSSHRQR